jgi:uncharacterized membrane protein YphA (DoxX/SURF4 family)
MQKERTVSLLLRISIAFSFIYVGISSFLNPTSWIGYIPGFIDNIFPRAIFLNIHAVIDILLGLWLLSNKKTFYSASLAAVILFGITIFNLSSMEIVFRDISILLAAIALAILHKETTSDF